MVIERTTQLSLSVPINELVGSNFMNIYFWCSQFGYFSFQCIHYTVYTVLGIEPKTFWKLWVLYKKTSRPRLIITKLVRTYLAEAAVPTSCKLWGSPDRRRKGERRVRIRGKFPKSDSNRRENRKPPTTSRKVIFRRGNNLIRN